MNFKLYTDSVINYNNDKRIRIHSNPGLPSRFIMSYLRANKYACCENFNKKRELLIKNSNNIAS